LLGDGLGVEDRRHLFQVNGCGTGV
jgi:hypothetical protein